MPVTRRTSQPGRRVVRRSDSLPAVTGPIRHVQAARGYLARLVVAIGVLAGLVLVHGVQCTDGMSAMAIEHVASSGMAVGAQDGAAPATMAAVRSSRGTWLLARPRFLPLLGTVPLARMVRAQCWRPAWPSSSLSWP